MRHISLPAFIFGSAILLAGCMEPGSIRGTIHSNSYKLRLGMTIEEVEAIMAPANYTRFDPKNALIVCRTYIYDEEVGAKFVHVKFENDLVVGASDGHRKVCNLTHSQN
jgi:hypothetical protein